MKRFKSILVGVNLSSADRLVGDEPGPTVQSVIDRALELAQRNSARVTLAFALDVSERARFLIDHADSDANGDADSEDNDTGLLSEINSILEKLEQPFRDAGVEVDHHVSIGPGWLELIYQVLKNEHDLVIVGARTVGPIERFFLGTTAIKLLRKCPCPVWVVKDAEQHKIDSVLVANDLSVLSNQAMELGCSLADVHNAQLHILHALEQPGEDAALATVIATKTNDDNFREVAEQEIQAQLKRIQPSSTPNVHVVEGAADLAVAEHLKQHDIDLLVMGTISRTGVPGLLTGSTAERLLPYLESSILAIKPEGFDCPISV